MASKVPGANTGEAFIGGAQSRNLAPPNVIGQGIPSANTGVGAPVGGVNPSQMKQARPNEGSNIGIPYTRLVPLQHRNALFAPKYLTNATMADYNGQYGNHVKKQLRTETEDLRPYTLAFVLGLRGGINGQQVPELLGAGGENPPVYNGHNVGLQPAIMPGMAGTERFQQLCSLEYLHAYFDNVLSGKVVELDAGMTRPGDLAKQVKGLQGSDAANAPDVYQGIFARDLGPFLKGKGGKTALVNCTAKNLPQQDPADPNKTIQPFAVSRNLGDDVAFERLEAAMVAQGLTDWRPDGIVLSKGVNDPSDKMSDEMLEARDGALYNLRVQGPAVGTTWTGYREMETLPMDKVFIVLIADVWFNKAFDKDGFKTKAAVDQYRKDRAAALAATGGENFDAAAYEALQANAYKGTGAPETTTLCNFRIEATTSSELINYSQFKPKQKASPGAKKRRLEGRSRNGLDICEEFGEFIVGGWQIGNVMDTSASRAAMPQGSNIGVRTAPNTSALNINVNIGWWSADRLCRAFNNAEGSITPRYVKPKEPDRVFENPVNAQLTVNEFP